MPYEFSQQTSAPVEPTKPRFDRDWEYDISAVKIEKCNESIDPLAYQAVFYLSKSSERADEKRSFKIGASFLLQRLSNLKKSGYKAPMTEKAIAEIEKKLGHSLPAFDAEHLGRLT